MSVLSKLFKREETRGAFIDSGGWSTNGRFEMSFSPGAITPDHAEALAAVQACVGAISSAISSLPVRLYRNNGKTRQEVNTGGIWALLKNGPNAYQSTPEFIETLVAQVLRYGNGLIEIVYDRHGRVVALQVVPWPWCNVQLLPNGRLIYDVFNQPGIYAPAQGKMRRLLQDEVIHIRDRSDDGIIGKSRISRGAATIHQAQLVHEFAANTFTNGVVPSGVISTDARMDGEQKRMVRDAITAAFAGAKGAAKVLVMDQALKWTSNAIVSPEDAELLASRKWSTEEVCRIFQVPPPIIQDYSHNTFTNSEQAGRWFAQFCLLPLVCKVEAAFNRALFPDGDYEIDLDMSAFDRGDPATRWQNHSIAISNGILSVDEVREVEGYSPQESEVKQKNPHTEAAKQNTINV